MATKRGMGACDITHNVTWPPENVITWGHVTKWKLNISSSTMPMMTKLCRVVTYNEGNSSIMPRESLATKSLYITCQTKNKISFLSSFARPMATKLGRVMIYDEGKPCMNFHDPLIMWSRNVKWQMKKVISPLLQSIWQPNLTGCWLMVRVTYSWSCTTF